LTLSSLRAAVAATLAETFAGTAWAEPGTAVANKAAKIIERMSPSLEKKKKRGLSPHWVRRQWLAAAFRRTASD
jgi:hypothetical protein